MQAQGWFVPPVQLLNSAHSLWPLPNSINTNSVNINMKTVKVHMVNIYSELYFKLKLGDVAGIVYEEN